MTYNEWRDELKNNLYSVSDAERRRVLDYYAEAYADRREAGFTEREIIEDFGAPYDAAQRILYDNDDTGFDSRRMPPYEDSRMDVHSARRERHDEKRGYREDYYEPQPQSQPQPQSHVQSNANTAKKREDYTWVFVLLCVIFAIPIFIVVMTMVGVTIGLCAAPFGLLATGIAQVFAGIGIAMGNASGGFVEMGLGIIQIGVAIALIPLVVWLVKLMWKLFKMFFRWVKQLFGGKEEG